MPPVDARPHVTRLDRVELALPARADALTTLRVIASSLGADVAFDVDEIDAVRVAVTEVFNHAIATPGIDRVRAAFEPSAQGLAVEMSAIGGTPLRLDDVAASILTSIVELTLDGGTVTVIRRHRTMEEAS